MDIRADCPIWRDMADEYPFIALIIEYGDDRDESDIPDFWDLWSKNDKKDR